MSDDGWFHAAIDGGARGNPGPAAWGVALLDADGSFREGHGGFLGNATNNVAEYTGLLEALRIAAERGARRVDIRSDSELMVKQLRGEYRVRNENLKPLYEEARRRIRGFESFRIAHVRRERNKDADRLVNAALDRAEAGGAADARVHELAES